MVTRLPRPTGTVVVTAAGTCGACSSTMTPFLWRPIDNPDRPHLFYQCDGDQDHVSACLPIPPSMVL